VQLDGDRALADVHQVELAGRPFGPEGTAEAPEVHRLEQRDGAWQIALLDEEVEVPYPPQPRILVERPDERSPLQEETGHAHGGQAPRDVGRQIRRGGATEPRGPVREPQAPKDLARHGVRPCLHRPIHERRDAVVRRQRFEARPIAGRELAGVRDVARAESRPQERYERRVAG